ncbi:MAG: pantetheine-phosphate adenylyltransferase [Legionellales bacterium]|jgi:pantetheine-phosphate adenylyltransferase|uniref:Phosphopantetheine adenylyltransferase n=1 Tax=marine metagenome TaxID=408172 RepID=A0A382IXW6_9ZZZZ|nr:pantetheine-phosphate adenylyltransferase [Legionellales bacterium]|tara:strand:- start:81 stop:557 length:477 start_codon:yes stop_codon:yes gene_type:complete
MVTAIYPGTFDPITNGHIDIAQRAAKLFDEVIIAVAERKAEKTLFTKDERLFFVNNLFSNIGNIKSISFDGLVTDLAREKSAKILIRGVRTILDFDYEFKMAGMNKKLYTDIETVFLTPTENFNYISSSLVREIAVFGGDVSLFVPQSIQLALKEKFS